MKCKVTYFEWVDHALPFLSFGGEGYFYLNWCYFSNKLNCGEHFISFLMLWIFIWQGKLWYDNAVVMQCW